MRTAFWVRLLALLACAGTAAADADSSRSAKGHAEAASRSAPRTHLLIQGEGGVRYRVRVTRDAAVSPDARPSQVRVLGESKGVAIVVMDSYPSRRGGMSYCQAGQERFLRIISVARPAPRETFRIKVESCRDNIELSDPAVEWLPESRSVRIHWLSGPAGNGQPETRTLRIGSDGRLI
jgi:hypothetical protein